MSEEIGNIEKPSADSFKGGRKLYVIPLLFAGKEAPQEYRERCEHYWQQVNEHLVLQESKVGAVTRIYHESITMGGGEGLKAMERWNQASYAIVRQRAERGATVEATELAELSDECMDWERCLMLGFFSRKVADTITENYRRSARERYEYISRHINESLQAGEIALLFIREGHGVQFPADADVFMVAPPALDEIHRWLRDRSRSMEAESGEEEGHEHEHGQENE